MCFFFVYHTEDLFIHSDIIYFIIDKIEEFMLANTSVDDVLDKTKSDQESIFKSLLKTSLDSITSQVTC